jgi:ribonuclease HI
MELHLQMASAPLEKHDFEVITDGSGAVDGFGASCAIIFSDKYNIFEEVLACRTHTSVDRAELYSLIIALETIIDRMDWWKKIQSLKSIPFTVHWACDRENLVRSIQRDENGKTIYRRKSSPDLWNQIKFFEQISVITAVHRERSSNTWHDEADMKASLGRLLIKDFVENGTSIDVKINK